MHRVTDEELELRRRSYVMLSPGQPAMSREEPIALVEELQRCRRRGRQLLGALREVALTANQVLRGCAAPGQVPK